MGSAVRRVPFGAGKDVGLDEGLPWIKRTKTRGRPVDCAQGDRMRKGNGRSALAERGYRGSGTTGGHRPPLQGDGAGFPFDGCGGMAYDSGGVASCGSMCPLLQFCPVVCADDDKENYTWQSK
jgi:hypothetical protein